MCRRLEYLGRRLDGVPIVVAGTVRPAEPGADAAGNEVRLAASPLLLVTAIGLGLATLILGGWLAPVSFSLVGMDTPQWIQGSMWFWNWFWLFAKTFCVVTVFLWVRSTFPRFRYDQIMRLGWKIFIPVTLVWLVLVGLWIQSPWNIWK